MTAPQPFKHDLQLEIRVESLPLTKWWKNAGKLNSNESYLYKYNLVSATLLWRLKATGFLLALSSMERHSWLICWGGWYGPITIFYGTIVVTIKVMMITIYYVCNCCVSQQSQPHQHKWSSWKTSPFVARFFRPLVTWRSAICITKLHTVAVT